MRSLVLAVLLIVIQVYRLLALPSQSAWKAGDIKDSSDDGIPDYEALIRQAIIQALEDLRSGMESGYPKYGIPSLDPLVLPFVPFNITFDDNTVFGNLTDSEVVNLSKFVISQILVNIDFGLFVNLGTETQDWSLHGTYDMDGNALGMDVYGSGSYHITLNDVQFGLFFDMTLGHWGKYVEVHDLNAHFMMKDADVKFEHLMGGGVTGALINEALGRELPKALKELQDLALPPILQLIKNKTNEYLEKFPIYPNFNITYDLSDDGYEWTV